MSGPLTSMRLRLSTKVGGPDEVIVETAAREGLAREVLVGRALPLLRRARRLLDEIADPDHGAPAPVWARDRAETVADAIAGLIGHPVTDQPAHPELQAVLAEGTPARLTWEQIASLPQDYQQALTPEQMPAEPAVPAETPAEKAARHERIEEALDRMGITVIPACPMAPYEHQVSDWEREREAAVPFMGKSSEPATRAPYGGRPVACDGCGATPDQGVMCLAPDGRHTWRPLDGPSNDELLRATPRCDTGMVHNFHPDRVHRVRMGFDLDGHPPNCPARTEPDVKAVRAAMDERDSGCRHCTGGCRACDARAMQTGGAFIEAFHAPELVSPEVGKSREPAAPVEETLQARAARLDRERDDAHRVARAATYAADEAWRAIGGRQ